MKTMILGWKHSKGNFEGTEYNYVTIYSTGRMERKETQQGSAGIELRGEPHLVDTLKKHDFNQPIQAEIQMETFALGKGATREMAVNITVLPPVK